VGGGEGVHLQVTSTSQEFLPTQAADTTAMLWFELLVDGIQAWKVASTSQ
jgi:hypothetical protein